MRRTDGPPSLMESATAFLRLLTDGKRPARQQRPMRVSGQGSCEWLLPCLGLPALLLLGHLALQRGHQRAPHSARLLGERTCLPARLCVWMHASSWAMVGLLVVLPVGMTWRVDLLSAFGAEQRVEAEFDEWVGGWAGQADAPSAGWLPCLDVWC